MEDFPTRIGGNNQNSWMEGIIPCFTSILRSEESDLGNDKTPCVWRPCQTTSRCVRPPSRCDDVTRTCLSRYLETDADRSRVLDRQRRTFSRDDDALERLGNPSLCRRRLCCQRARECTARRQGWLQASPTNESGFARRLACGSIPVGKLVAEPRTAQIARIARTAAYSEPCQ